LDEFFEVRAGELSVLLLGAGADEDVPYIAGADMGKQSLAVDVESARRFLGAVE